MNTLVGKQAPDFTSPAVLHNGEIVEEFHLSQTRKGKYAFLFFYPLDFTFVCPTELIALHHRVAEFTKRNVEIIGISVDSQYTHHAWRNTPANQGGIGPLDYTLVADVAHSICRSYGIEVEDSGVALRASFLIDRGGVVRHQVVNDLPLGRNIDEMLRMVDALQYHEEHGEVCPAGWRSGEAGMKETSAGVAHYLEQYAETL